jgi:hypothetical protein
VGTPDPSLQENRPGGTRSETLDQVKGSHCHSTPAPPALSKPRAKTIFISTGTKTGIKAGTKTSAKTGTDAGTNASAKARAEAGPETNAKTGPGRYQNRPCDTRTVTSEP